MKKVNIILKLIILLMVFSCAHYEKFETKVNNDTDARNAYFQKRAKTNITYHLDVSNPKDDLFHITVTCSGLTTKNDTFHFVSTAPGTYKILDYGRYVQSFKAYDNDNKEVPTYKISTNSWHISRPKDVRKLVYDIDDSAGSDAAGPSIAPMMATEISEEHAVINTFLELSGGKRGLREVMIELSKKYGQKKSFEDNEFFDLFVKHTYPEIKSFINDYIRDTKSYPIKEYYKKIGIKYVEKKEAQKDPKMGISFNMSEKNRLRINAFSASHINYGLQIGDIITKLNGMDINVENMKDIANKVKNGKKVGDHYQITVKRNGQELTYTGTFFQTYEYDIKFKIDKNASKEQIELRRVWLKNI